MSYSDSPDLIEVLGSIGSKLRERREDLGLSQEEFAAKAGFHRTYIGSVERGEQNITMGSYCKFMKALQADPCAFFVEACRSIQGLQPKAR
jgi:transcriptional regulator with XRE-family HTH domain